MKAAIFLREERFEKTTKKYKDRGGLLIEKRQTTRAHTANSTARDRLKIPSLKSSGATNYNISPRPRAGLPLAAFWRRPPMGVNLTAVWDKMAAV